MNYNRRNFLTGFAALFCWTSLPKFTQKERLKTGDRVCYKRNPKSKFGSVGIITFHETEYSDGTETYYAYTIQSEKFNGCYTIGSDTKGFPIVNDIYQKA